MKVLLFDSDSRIPNLALMKVSAYHKAQGDRVSFMEDEPDRVYASIIFKANSHKADGLRFLYPDAEILIGGSGFSLETCLEDAIEYLMPDYSLYDGLVCENCGSLMTACDCRKPTRGNITYSMGFTTRGCIRRCYFCIVPEKEGRLQRWQHPREWHNDAYSKVLLMDNNWIADKDWFLETSQWLRDHGLSLREGGLDFRLLDDDIARRLSELKWYAPMHFAFDSDKDEQAVLDGIAILKAAGIKVRNDILVYVYCHNDKHYDSAVARCRTLKENGVTPFVMWNAESKKTPRIRSLIRWGTRAWATWAIDIDDYDRTR